MSARLALTAVAALAAAGFVRRSAPSGSRKTVQYKILPTEGEGGLDEYENEALDLLDEVNIKASPKESLVFVAVRGRDRVIGALFASDEDDGDEPKRRFTVAVSPDHQRKLIGYELVRALEESTSELAAERGHPIMLEAWVVNPHMASLIRREDLGFDEGYRGWSQDDPMMHKWVG